MSHLLKAMDKWEEKRLDNPSVCKAFVDCIARLGFVVAIAIAQIVDCCEMALYATFHLFTAFCREESLFTLRLSLGAFVFGVFNFVVVQASVVRPIFLPLMDWLSPKATHDLEHWHNSEKRKKCVFSHIYNLNKDLKSQHYLLHDYTGKVLKFLDYSPVSNLAVALILIPIYILLSVVIAVVDVLISFVFILVTAVKCSVGCADKGVFSKSFYNCIYEIDFVFAQIVSVLNFISVIPLELLSFAGCYDDKEKDAIISGSLDKNLSAYYKIADKDMLLAVNNI